MLKLLDALSDLITLLLVLSDLRVVAAAVAVVADVVALTEVDVVAAEVVDVVASVTVAAVVVVEVDVEEAPTAVVSVTSRVRRRPSR